MSAPRGNQRTRSSGGGRALMLLGVLLTHQRALDLKYLIETGKVDIAIRSPKDGGSAGSDETTTAVTPAYISGQFDF
jgi:hypothetical protein